MIDGAYWMRRPGPNAEIVVAYTGAVATEAWRPWVCWPKIAAMSNSWPVTSADRLNAGWTAAARARERGVSQAVSHVERLLMNVPDPLRLVTVIDGHPATLRLARIGQRYTAHGPLGVEHFGQTGSIVDLYRHFGIDAQSIVRAAASISAGRPGALLRAVG